MGGSADDPVRRHGANRPDKAIRIGEVAAQLTAVRIQRNQLAEGRKAALQLPTDLAVFAEQENFHQARPA